MLKSKASQFLFILFLVFAGAVQADSQYNRIYIFGDSLSDTGNLASITDPFLPMPPYYMNRVTNGPVAIETLAELLGLSTNPSLHFFGTATGNNFAVASAKAFGPKVIDLDNQISAFLAQPGHIAPSDALYVMFIGGNDIRGARDTLNRDEGKALVEAAIDRVRQAIMDLALSGAEEFLLVNAPNIGNIPETRRLALTSTDTHFAKQATKLSRLYKNKLHQLADQLEDDMDLEITEFNLFKYFDRLVKRADQFGFINNTDACFSTIILYPDSVCPNFHPDCACGSNADQFIFFDEIHPTARVHANIGQAFFQQLSDEQD